MIKKVHAVLLLFGSMFKYSSEHDSYYTGPSNYVFKIISCQLSDLSHGLLVLDLSCSQQPHHVLGPLSHGVLHAIVMPQLLHAQLHPTQVRLTWDTE